MERKKKCFLQIKNMLTAKNKPDGIVASVERIAMSVYLVCQEINISIPADLKVLVFFYFRNSSDSESAA